MKFLVATLILILLFWPIITLAEKNNLSYEFSQFGERYTFCGTFSTMAADPDDLLHILYDFQHLTKFVSSPYSIILLRQGRNWYEVCYTYRKLLLQNKFAYRRALIEGEQKITFELIASEQTDPIFPKILSSRGYYEVKPEGKGCRIIYFEEVQIGSKLPNGFSSHFVKKEAVKFLQGLKKYVERTCD